MKKLIAPLTLAASLVTLPAFAGEFLIGGTGFNGTLVTDFTQDPPGGGTSFAATAENSELGGGLYFGWIWNVNMAFNVGIEGFFDFINVSTVASLATPQPLENKVEWLGGLRVLPSFKITNNTEIYIELGWAMVSDTFTDQTSGDSVKKDISSFRYGAGTQTMIYDNVSLRIYYSVIDQMAALSLATVVDGTLSAKPSMNIFGIGVGYHFQF